MTTTDAESPMLPDFNEFLAEHSSLTRRYFLRFGTAGVAAMGALPVIAKEGEYDPELAKSIDDVEPGRVCRCAT